MMYMAPFAAHLLISGNGSRIWKAIAGGEEGKAYGDL